MSKSLKQPSPGPDEGGFLSRWSRLKAESQHPAKESTAPQQHLPEESPLANKEEAPVPVLTDADMPDLNTLNGESDYSGFLSPGVSEQLRKLALRKLFSTEHFHLRDGLDDYDEEFTHFEKLGDIITADMRFQMEQEAKAKLNEQLAAEQTEPVVENPGQQELNSTDIEEDEFDELTEEDMEIAADTIDSTTSEPVEAESKPTDEKPV